MGERSWRFERELLGASHICPFRSFSWKPLGGETDEPICPPQVRPRTPDHQCPSLSLAAEKHFRLTATSALRTSHGECLAIH